VNSDAASKKLKKGESGFADLTINESGDLANINVIPKFKQSLHKRA